jgi:probable HAF family extracellular repeat protein
MYTVTSLGPNYVESINDKGQVLVQTGQDANNRLVVYNSLTDGSLTDVKAGGSSAAINNRGDVAVVSFGYGGNHLLLNQGGQLTDIHPPEEAPTSGPGSISYVSSVAGITDDGQVVGTVLQASGTFAPFVQKDGKMTVLQAPPTSGGVGATGVNNAGQIIGYPGALNTALVSRNGVMTPLTTASGPLTASQPFGINNSGAIVGQTFVSYPYFVRGEAFLYKDGTITYLGSLKGSGINGETSLAHSINDAGQIVGNSSGPIDYTSNNGRAFLYQDGKMQDLNDLVTLPPGWRLFDATRINNLGQIIARETNLASGWERSVLLTPSQYEVYPSEPLAVPEPGPLAMAVVVLLGLGARSWYRRGFRPVRAS